MSARDFLRRAFVENAALKVVALLLAVTLFIVVRGDKDMVISFSLKVGYTEPEGRVLVSPPVDHVRVTVKGPWTRVKRFDERSVEPIQVDLTQLSDGEYVFTEEMIDLPRGLRVTGINPPSVMLRFERTATRVVPVTPVLSGEPARGYEVVRRTATPSHVMVRGAKSVVDATTEARTRPVDLAGRSDSFRVKVELERPEGPLTVVDAPAIEVEVAIAEQSGEVAVDVPVDVRGTPGVLYREAGVSPRTVRVLLRGSKNALDAVDKRALRAYVDVLASDVGAAVGRQAEVFVEDVPPGVAVAVEPRRVTLLVK